jgi:hypothetical protein
LKRTLPISLFFILLVSAFQAVPPVAEQPITTEDVEIPEPASPEPQPEPTSTQSQAPAAPTATTAAQATEPAASGPKPTPITLDPFNARCTGTVN